jgi:hypothetical protein
VRQVSAQTAILSRRTDINWTNQFKFRRLGEFLDYCRVECEFLVRDYGFERLVAPLEHNRYSVRFRKGEFEVAIYGETYGLTASCDLVRRGERLPLGLLLPPAEPRRHKRKRVRAGQLAQVQEIATQLNLHASDWLRGETSRFDAALADWRRRTRPRALTEAQRIARQRQQAATAAGHAMKGGGYAEVVRLLEPHSEALSPHQQRMLDVARDRLGKTAWLTSRWSWRLARALRRLVKRG